MLHFLGQFLNFDIGKLQHLYQFLRGASIVLFFRDHVAVWVALLSHSPPQHFERISDPSVPVSRGAVQTCERSYQIIFHNVLEAPFPTIPRHGVVPRFRSWAFTSVTL